MFESAFIDKFSRTHWSVVPILYIPAVAILLWLSVSSGVDLWTMVGLFAGGWLWWTFVEYWLHRTLFHWIPNDGWGARMHFLLHGVHHDWPRDRYRLVMPPAVSIVLFWFFLGCYVPLLGEQAWGFHAGMVSGYMAYDIIHYMTHHVSPSTPWMKAIRKHHLAHHSPKLQREGKFGVSSPLWDHVFRTL